MRYHRLVAPVVTLMVVLLLLLAAARHEEWVLKPPPCSLRTLTGIPCLTCGGTRAMQALSQGEIATALRFNPLVVLGVFAAGFWLLWSLFVTVSMRGESNESDGREDLPRGKKMKRWGIVISVLLVLNWIYLICFLPP